jgi:hypothetical protein
LLHPEPHDHPLLHPAALKPSQAAKQLLFLQREMLSKTAAGSRQEHAAGVPATTSYLG